MTHIITTTIAERLYVHGGSSTAIQSEYGISIVGGVITLDFQKGNNFTLTLTGTSLLAAPNNALAGQSGIILFAQDDIGNRVMSFNSVWRFPNNNIPSLSILANTVDGLAYAVRVGGSSPIISCQLLNSI